LDSGSIAIGRLRDYTGRTGMTDQNGTRKCDSVGADAGAQLGAQAAADADAQASVRDAVVQGSAKERCACERGGEGSGAKGGVGDDGVIEGCFVEDPDVSVSATEDDVELDAVPDTARGAVPDAERVVEVAQDSEQVEGDDGEVEDEAEGQAKEQVAARDVLRDAMRDAERTLEQDAVAVAREETKKVRDQLIRLAADFDNFRKRAQRENQDASRRAKIDVLAELFPVFDNMYRAVAHAQETASGGSESSDVQSAVGLAEMRAVVTGITMVVRQFEDALNKMGVERVKSVGEQFDPVVHEAVQMLATADVKAGTVVAEVLGGYRWGERLLRAAMVVVAKAPAAAPLEVQTQANPTGDVRGDEQR
jgi:molecular chaperone GrpE